MIEEEEVEVAPEQQSVDSFVKEFTLGYMREDIILQMNRLRFKANAMSKKEFEEKQNMLEATLIGIDNDDLEGLTFDKMKEFEEKLWLLPVDEETRRHGMEATYAERVKAFEDNFEEKSKKAEDFVRKMSAERKERVQKKREDRKKRKMQLNHKIEKKKAKDERNMTEKAEMRKQMEEEIKQRMKDHERQRHEMMEKWKSDEKQLAKKKYKHVEMEEKYNKNVLMPSLERKKEELRKKREYFQPISHKEMVDHEKVYVERLKQKLKEKKNKREKWYKDIGYGDYDTSRFQSKYLSSAENESTQVLIDPRLEVVEKWDKQKNYAKFVKEMHKPKISVHKKKEMKQIIKEVEKSGQSRKLVDNRNKSHGALSSIAKSNARPQYENYLRSRPYGSQSATRSKQHKQNEMIPRKKLVRKGIVVDYLLNKRIRRQERVGENLEYGIKNKTNCNTLANKQLSHIRNNSSAYDDESTIVPQSRFAKEMTKSEDEINKQRLEIIKTRAKQIEHDALEKEKNMKLTNNHNIRANNEINSMYIDSIEAKLHLLKDI